MKLQTERTMRNNFKCQHGLDKISYFHHFKVQVLISTSKMNYLTFTVMIVCLSIPTTGIPLEEGPVGGRGSGRTFVETFNITGSRLPTFAEGPVGGRRPEPSIPNPGVPESDEVTNSSAPNDAHMFEIQHGGRDTRPPATNAKDANTNKDTDNDAIFTSNDPSLVDVTNSPPGKTGSSRTPEHLSRVTNDDFTQNMYSALTTASYVSGKKDIYEDEFNSHPVTPHYSNTHGDSGQDSGSQVPESADTNIAADNSVTDDYSEDDFTTQAPGSIDSRSVKPTVHDSPNKDTDWKKVIEKLESLEVRYSEFQEKTRQSQIDMSHEILLLKEALELERNITKNLAFQMTHMMEAINDRLINISQKWTHPLLNLTNYPMGAQGCRYSSFHRSSSVADNSTSTAWAPNDTEAERYMATGAACSASIGARAYLERRTVPLQPELMQFRCTCTESRNAAVMRTCELHIWECFR